jgi:hypothetical protein
MIPDADSERNPVEELAEEFAARHRRGERPSLTEYTERYPQWADEIRDLFPALVLMEQFKPPLGAATGAGGPCSWPAAPADDSPPAPAARSAACPATSACASASARDVGPQLPRGALRQGLCLVVTLVCHYLLNPLFTTG